MWFIFTPTQAGYLLDKKNKPSELARSGELLSFREVLAIGCVGGFFLLTFITAFCSWVTLRIAGVL